MAYSDTLEYLYALKNRGSKFGIDRMERFVEALGHPQKKFPIIHVAGTNGKGSVCAMLEALYRSNGYRTGLFSSPHLVDLGERVQVDRRILTEAGIIRYTDELRPIAEELGEEDSELHPTFFEFVAAMAFLRFASEGVDLALIETGLGGRLDATNVVDPELSIITSISFDHMDLLGDTLAKIASEKAGIIKPGKPVLIGCLPEEAEIVIRAKAEEQGSKLYSVKERFNEATLPETNLAGDFQRWNAAVAVYATEILAERFPARSTEDSKSDSKRGSRCASASVCAFSNEALMQIDWPGRWQKLEYAGRTLILDATHNPEGAEALRNNLERLTETEGKPIIVAGSLGEERGRSLMEAVAPFARELYLVEPNQDRATPTDFLESCLPQERDFAAHHSTVDDLFSSVGAPLLTGVASAKPVAEGPEHSRGADARVHIGSGAASQSTKGTPASGVPTIKRSKLPTIGQPGDTIVVTGSIYLIGEVLERIQGSSHLRRGYGGHAGSGGALQDKF